MLLALVPTAVPASVTLPDFTEVQWPPVLPVMTVSAMVSVPPKLLLVKNTPPPNALAPAALFTTLSPHNTMFTGLSGVEIPSLYNAPPLPPEPTWCWPLLITLHLVASSLLAS